MSAKQYDWVVVAPLVPYDARPEDPPEHVQGEYSRWGKRGKWMKQVKNRVFIDGYTLAEVIETLQESAQGLDSPTVHVDQVESRWDNTTDVEIHVYGKREATEEEIPWIADQKAARAAYDAESKARAIQAARDRLERLLAE